MFQRLAFQDIRSAAPPSAALSESLRKNAATDSHEPPRTRCPLSVGARNRPSRGLSVTPPHDQFVRRPAAHRAIVTAGDFSIVALAAVERPVQRRRRRPALPRQIANLARHTPALVSAKTRAAPTPRFARRAPRFAGSAGKTATRPPLRGKQEPRCIQLLTPVQRTSEIDKRRLRISQTPAPARRVPLLPAGRRHTRRLAPGSPRPRP